MKITIDVPEVKILATDIKWDTDEEDEDITLPSEIDVPDSVVESMFKEHICPHCFSELFVEFIGKLENDISIISDYISDKTGFCHEGFNITVEYEERR